MCNYPNVDLVNINGEILLVCSQVVVRAEMKIWYESKAITLLQICEK